MKTTHKVILGDCLEKLKEIPDKSVDLVFADPPYNMSKKKGLGWKYSKHITMQEEWDMFSKDEFFQFNQQWIRECIRILKHGGKELNPVINKIGVIPSKAIAIGVTGLMGYFVSWGIFVPLDIIMIGCCVWNYTQIRKYKKVS